MIKAQNLLAKLETNEEVRKYIRKQEQEQIQAEKTAKDAAISIRKARWKSIQLMSILGGSVLLFIISMFVDFKPGVFLSIVGLALFLYLLYKPDTTN